MWPFALEIVADATTYQAMLASAAWSQILVVQLLKAIRTAGCKLRRYACVSGFFETYPRSEPIKREAYKARLFQRFSVSARERFTLLRPSRLPIRHVRGGVIQKI